MKPEFDPTSLLETLDPPAGGLAKLRRRLDRRNRRRVVVQRSLAFAGAAAVVVVLAVAIPLVGSSSRAPLPIGDELVAMQLGIVASPTEAASVPTAERTKTALLRVPTDDDRVVLYLVGSMSGG